MDMCSRHSRSIPSVSTWDSSVKTNFTPIYLYLFVVIREKLLFCFYYITSLESFTLCTQGVCFPWLTLSSSCHSQSNHHHLSIVSWEGRTAAHPSAKLPLCLIVSPVKWNINGSPARTRFFILLYCFGKRTFLCFAAPQKLHWHRKRNVESEIERRCILWQLPA